MKLVLAVKSLLLKGINRTIKRLLFPLLATLALPTAVNAEPMPKISDYELLSTKGERFEFLCPKERYKEDEKIT